MKKEHVVLRLAHGGLRRWVCASHPAARPIRRCPQPRPPLGSSTKRSLSCSAASAALMISASEHSESGERSVSSAWRVPGAGPFERWMSLLVSAAFCSNNSPRCFSTAASSADRTVSLGCALSSRASSSHHVVGDLQNSSIPSKHRASGVS